MRRAALVGVALAAGCTTGPLASAAEGTGPRIARPPLLRPHLSPHFAPLRPGLRPLRHPFGIRPFLGRRHPNPGVPPYLLPSPPPDTFIQPEGPGASPLIEGAPDRLPAFAHGFHLDVAVGAGQTFAAPSTLDRFVEVGQALGRCFAPPSGLAWGSVTLRVSFKRDGSVFGLPRIPYSDAATMDQKTELADSLLAGLKRCAPLPLSPSLGAAVAGEIFAIRFIHEDKR